MANDSVNGWCHLEKHNHLTPSTSKGLKWSTSKEHQWLQSLWMVFLILAVEFSMGCGAWQPLRDTCLSWGNLESIFHICYSFGFSLFANCSFIFFIHFFPSFGLSAFLPFDLQEFFIYNGCWSFVKLQISTSSSGCLFILFLISFVHRIKKFYYGQIYDLFLYSMFFLCPLTNLFIIFLNIF